MRTDELRRELSALADEIPAFSGDPQSVRRRVTRRRIVGASALIAIVVAGSLGALALAHRHANRVEVENPRKEVAPRDLQRISAVVFLPASARESVIAKTRDALNRSAVVARFTEGAGSSRPTFEGSIDPCGAGHYFAVQSTTPGHSIRAALSRQLDPMASIDDESARELGDAEVFMRNPETSAQVDAVRAAIASDRSVNSIRFLDHKAAYAEFRSIFAKQPDLLEATKPSDLPESFQITLKDPASVDVFTNRYRSIPGVDQVITRRPPSSRFPIICSKP